MIETYLRILNIYSNTSHNIEKAKIYNVLGKLHIKKEEYGIATNFLQESLKLLSDTTTLKASVSNTTALRASVCNKLAYISAKQCSYKEAEKDYQNVLELYKGLQKEDNAYTGKVILTLKNLITVTVTDKLDKEDIIDVDKYYHEIFEQSELLDKSSKIYHELRIKTENNQEKRRKNLSDSRQIKKLTEEMVAQRNLLNNILNVVSSLTNKRNIKYGEKKLESDAHVDDLTITPNLEKTRLDNEEKEITSNSDSLNLFKYIRKMFKKD